MKNIQSFFLFFLLSLTINAQTLKSPSDFLGYEIGSAFSRHHQVVDYFKHIAANSTNVKLQQYGFTNENRPLYISFISSEENLKNLEQIRLDNLKRTGIVSGKSDSNTVIVWLSYNVHGNEASSSEAAMKTAYELLTSKKEWLKNTIIILDPCVNPDGRDRYVNWYNQTKSSPFNTNPETREHNEPWPGGRPNHYLFDLNRDWAWATQIETQHRLKLYNKWMPQVHVDFHEQGINSPYYFAPAAEPFHEIVSDWQREFQHKIGKNHAKYFDKNGWQYFTKESFDLLYPSYGDTYPTFMGAIGMTYEQAGHGRAGLGINVENGTVLTLKDRMNHHTTSGLSTVEMASKYSEKLVEEFSNFFNNSNLKEKAFIVRGDETKINSLVKLLNKHEIKSYKGKSNAVKVLDYDSNKTKTIKITSSDLVIPTSQPKGKMVKVLFEKNAKISTAETYDITAWSLPFAYGLQGYSTSVAIDLGTAYETKKPKESLIDKKAYAYVHKWNEVADATFLGNLLQEGFNVRFSNKDFSVDGKNFKKGSLIIIRGENKHLMNFDGVLVEIANRLSQKIISVSTGFVESGADFGSNSVQLIKRKNIAVVGGKGTSSINFGEIWHFFEKQLNYPVHNINTENLSKVKIVKYNVLILPEYYRAKKTDLEIINEFAANGGTVISIGSSMKNFANKEGFSLKTKKIDKKETSKTIPYKDRRKEYSKNSSYGSIFKSSIDDSHPLAFGYSKTYYPLMLNSSSYELLENGFNIGYFDNKVEVISGYAGDSSIEKIQNSLLFGIERKGNGKIIYLKENPLFRSFWENGKLFFCNALFLN